MYERENEWRAWMDCGRTREIVHFSFGPSFICFIYKNNNNKVCVFVCVSSAAKSNAWFNNTQQQKKAKHWFSSELNKRARARVSCGFWRERVALMATNRVRINIKYTFGVRIFAICVFCVLRFGKQNLRLTNWLGLVRFAHTSEPFCARWMDTTACYFPLSNNTINSATNFT